MDTNIDREQFYQLARWSIVGRLTASLLHEINNPMQAIRGSLSLALEELDDADSLKTYIDLGVRESNRVIDLIARARRIYSNVDQTPVYLDVNLLLRESSALMAKELVNKRVKLEMALAPTLPGLHAVFADLSLAFLCPMFAISDSMVSNSGGVLCVRSATSPGWIEVTLETAVLPNLPPNLALPVCRRIVGDYGGHIQQGQEDGLAYLRISLPISPDIA
jgi:nitrogen-specific signal transduction histidine kinase